MSHALSSGRDRSPSALTQLFANAGSAASDESVGELRVKNMVGVVCQPRVSPRIYDFRPGVWRHYPAAERTRRHVAAVRAF